MTHQTIAIRPARRADADDLVRLAALDSAQPLTGDVLVATVDGAPYAALQLADGRAVATPFERTTALVELLRVRAQELHPSRALRHRAPSAPAVRLALAP